MYLPNITNINVYGLAKRAKTIDLSNSYIPKLTRLCFGDASYTRYSEDIRINNITAPNITNLSYLCGYEYYLTHFEAEGLDTSKVTDMRYLFYYCRVLPDLDLSH